MNPSEIQDDRTHIRNGKHSGYVFFHAETNSSRIPGTAVLLHGWGVRAKAMSRLADMLADAGYSVLNYDYPSSEKSILEHGKIFLELLREESPSGPLYFLTHSMGGLVLRTAMSLMTEAECRKIEAIVMLGPPNRGSFWAAAGNNRAIRKFNKSLGDMTRGPDSAAANIPPPAFLPPLGIIAGKFDGKVALKDTIPPDGMKFQRICLPVTHPGLRNPKNTGAEILTFFKEKKLQEFHGSVRNPKKKTE